MALSSAASCIIDPGLGKSCTVLGPISAGPGTLRLVPITDSNAPNLMSPTTYSTLLSVSLLRKPYLYGQRRTCKVRLNTVRPMFLACIHRQLIHRDRRCLEIFVPSRPKTCLYPLYCLLLKYKQVLCSKLYSLRTPATSKAPFLTGLRLA